MICPCCHNSCDDQSKFCPWCGADLPAPASQPESAPAPEFAPATPAAIEETPIPAPEVPAREEKKGRRWPAVLALAIMIFLGISMFFLSSLLFPNDTPWFTVDNGTLYFDNDLYTAHGGSEELTVPEAIAGEPVLRISDQCFSGCNQLTTVILPETLEFIGMEAFSGCDALRGIYIPESVSEIGDRAFWNCAQLEAIHLHDGLLSVGEDFLDFCDNLLYIFYTGTFEEWSELCTDNFNENTRIIAADGTYFPWA